VVSGEPLFSTRDEFVSGSGCPSFSKALESANIVEHTDRSTFMTRTEVRSRFVDSHLGHLFSDGTAPTGQRYCSRKRVPRTVLRVADPAGRPINSRFTYSQNPAILTANSTLRKTAPPVAYSSNVRAAGNIVLFQ
ncbi:MAG: hypothetical protein GY866_33655, partial [Proteobacteria bacterium]|nr:hypothetical protein [Pseudomonadota bacterium]